MKDFAEDNFKFDENGRKLSKPVENTVGKRRNCSLRAISPFPHSVFIRLVSRGRQKVSLCGNGLEALYGSAVKQRSRDLMALGLSLTRITWFKIFPQQQILDSSKLKEFTDDNFKLDENGRKVSKLV